MVKVIDYFADKKKKNSSLVSKLDYYKNQGFARLFVKIESLELKILIQNMMRIYT